MPAELIALCPTGLARAAVQVSGRQVRRSPDRLKVDIAEKFCVVVDADVVANVTVGDTDIAGRLRPGSPAVLIGKIEFGGPQDVRLSDRADPILQIEVF